MVYRDGSRYEYHLYIVYGWRDAHYSKNVMLALIFNVICKKQNDAHIFPHPHFCVFDTIHIAG